MAVSPRIHWVNLSFLPVLDVLPRGPAQTQADHPVVGLHPRSDGAECAVVAGGNPWDEVRGLILRNPGPLLFVVAEERSDYMSWRMRLIRDHHNQHTTLAFRPTQWSSPLKQPLTILHDF